MAPSLIPALRQKQADIWVQDWFVYTGNPVLQNQKEKEKKN